MRRQDGTHVPTGEHWLPVVSFYANRTEASVRLAATKRRRGHIANVNSWGNLSDPLGSSSTFLVPLTMITEISVWILPVPRTTAMYLVSFDALVSKFRLLLQD